VTEKEENLINNKLKLFNKRFSKNLFVRLWNEDEKEFHLWIYGSLDGKLWKEIENFDEENLAMFKTFEIPLQEKIGYSFVKFLKDQKID